MKRLRLSLFLLPLICGLLISEGPIRVDRGESSDSSNDDGYPAQAADFRALSLRDEHGVIRQDGLLRAREHLRAMKAAADRRRRGREPASANVASGSSAAGADGMAAQDAASARSLAWQWLGPGNIGGRVRSIVIHPSNPSMMFAGSVSGGIWKTTDG